MLFHLLFLIPASFGKEESLPETKHLDGSIFGWADALALQRKMWSSLPIPYVRFDSSNVNIAKIAKEFISGQLDMNISAIIQEMINSMQESLDSNNETDDEEYQEFTNSKNQQIYKLFNRNLKDNDEYDDEKSIQCGKDEYPNAYLLTQLLGDGFFNITECKTIDDIIGQTFSYALIIVPIIIITVFSLLYYFIFCILRCCCCRAKDRFNPGCFSIICFIIVLICLLVSLGFSIASSTFMYKILDYITSKKILTEAETVCELINPSIGGGLRKAKNQLIPAIENISGQTVKTIDDSLPQLMAVFNSTIDNISSISLILNGFVEYGQIITESCENSEDEFNMCIERSNPNLQGECQNSQLPSISLISKFTDFDSANQTANDLNGYLANITDVIDVSSFINSGKDTLVDSIDSIQESMSSFDDIKIVDKCDFHDYLDFLDDLPSFIIPVAKFALFLLPLFLFILIVIQISTFWTKGCCSRCCAACCIPCCVCTFCQFLIGLFSSILLIFLLFTNIFVEQGDDVFDVFLQEMTKSDEKVIDFGYLNLSSVSKGVIGRFPLDQIKLKKIHFIKNFVYANLDSKMSTILSTSELPFDDMAKMIETALVSASNTTNLDGLIVAPMQETINETVSSLPDSSLTEIANMDEMRDVLNSYEKIVKQCYTTCDTQFSELNDNYGEFFDNFTLMRNTFASTKEKVEPILNEVPQKVSLFANDLFGGLLRTMGKTVGDTLRLIIPVFDSVDMKWLIGAFNIVRVRLCYNFFAAVVCISLSAHLFVVGMTSMSLLIWIRRRGMAKEKKEDSDDEDTEKEESEKEVEYKKKKFGRKRLRVQNYEQEMP